MKTIIRSLIHRYSQQQRSQRDGRSRSKDILWSLRSHGLRYSRPFVKPSLVGAATPVEVELVDTDMMLDFLLDYIVWCFLLHQLICRKLVVPAPRPPLGVEASHRRPIIFIFASEEPVCPASQILTNPSTSGNQDSYHSKKRGRSMPLVDPGSAVFAAFGDRAWHVDATNHMPCNRILRNQRNPIDDEGHEATTV
jgi:hypothetical protein